MLDYMSTARRARVTVTLPGDLLERVDRSAREQGVSRSGLMESWLRESARRHVEREIQRATIAYYEGLTDDERREDEDLARALSLSASRVDVDGTGRAGRLAARGRRQSRSRRARASS